MSNTFTKFIDSCVGAIARKVQDEFDESKHPRDKGGRFSSKGGEGRGGSTKASKGSSNSNEELIQVKRAATAARRFKSSGIDLASAMEDLDIPTEGVPEKYLESVFEGSLSEDPKLLRKAEDYIERYESGELEKEADRSGSEEDDDDEGYMGLSKEELAEEEEYENARERARREKDDDRVTGPEDWDYMNEEDDDGVPSLEQYKENVRENFDGDEEYEVEARYDRAKFHSDKFKKLQNGEYDGTPEEKRLKNYYRRLGMKKPEDAFKVWWDI